MCGIFGIANPRSVGIGSEAARRCLDLLAERGPDDSGWYEDEAVMLGHRRLSIMDPSPAGRQPMSNEDGSVWITFNGEIYRFWKLRQELERLGHVFRSRSDTEVLLHGYEAWGLELLDRIDGMFAFAIWDVSRRSLLLARDRLGKKPLFWTRRRDALAFASLLRPLVAGGFAEPAVPRHKLREFLFYNYVIGPEAIFDGVELLPAGTWLRFENGSIERGRYWSLLAAAPRAGLADPQDEFERMLAEATTARMVSDAPVGIFLSGGVDSSVVAALATRGRDDPVRSFTVGFEEPSYDERAKARRVAAHLGTEHHEVVCRAEDVPRLLPRLAASADHLLADQSMIPLSLLAFEAKRSVKVVLTGDGGDELLAGYPTYRALGIARHYVRWVPGTVRARLAQLARRLPARTEKMALPMLLGRFLGATTGGLAEAHASWRAIWTGPEITALLGSSPSVAPEWLPYAAQLEGEGRSLLQRAVHADVSTWLVDSILAKVDRATMVTGLEPRSPLLDSRLLEFAFASLLAEPRNAGKLPLRRLARTLLGPELASAPKEGFQTPFARWLAGPLRDYVRESLASLETRIPGVFAPARLRAVEAEHASGVRNHDLKLWSLIVLAEWAKLFPTVHVIDEGADAGRPRSGSTTRADSIS